MKSTKVCAGCGRPGFTGKKGEGVALHWLHEKKLVCIDCKAKLPSSGPTPGSALTRKSKLVPGSVKAYASDYRNLGFYDEQAMALAQLAYAQDQIRKRLDAQDVILLASVLGMVEIQGTHHMLSCAKRENVTNACDCDVAKETKG